MNPHVSIIELQQSVAHSYIGLHPHPFQAFVLEMLGMNAGASKSKFFDSFEANLRHVISTINISMSITKS